MWSLLKKAEISEDVAQDLARGVDLLVETGAPIREIRLFGGLHKGAWRRFDKGSLRKSDIDLAVFMDDDPRYSVFANPISLTLDSKMELVPVLYGPTPEQRRLVETISDSPDLIFSSRYELHIVTPSDLKRFRREKVYLQNMSHQQSLSLGKKSFRPFVRAMKRGRVLYP